MSKMFVRAIRPLASLACGALAKGVITMDLKNHARTAYLQAMQAVAAGNWPQRPDESPTRPKAAPQKLEGGCLLIRLSDYQRHIGLGRTI